MVTAGDHGAGVIEAIDALLADERTFAGRAAERRKIKLGKDDEAVLRAGAWRRVDRRLFRHRQIHPGHRHSSRNSRRSVSKFCVLDPEGDYDDLQDAIVLGDGKRAPVVDEILDILRKPVSTALVVNMLGLPVAERPAFLSSLLSPIHQLRSQDGAPALAAHRRSASYASGDLGNRRRQPTGSTGGRDLRDRSSGSDAAEDADRRADGDRRRAKGERGRRQLLQGGRCAGPRIFRRQAMRTRCCIGTERSEQAPRWISVDRPQQEHQRHTRKYAEGQLGEDKSFYFRGPQAALNLRAHNLMIFMQMADGVDDATWLHHLHRGDYSRWFREAIKDDELAEEAESVQDGADPRRHESRSAR